MVDVLGFGLKSDKELFAIAKRVEAIHVKDLMPYRTLQCSMDIQERKEEIDGMLMNRYYLVMTYVMKSDLRLTGSRVAQTISYDIAGPVEYRMQVNSITGGNVYRWHFTPVIDLLNSNDRPEFVTSLMTASARVLHAEVLNVLTNHDLDIDKLLTASKASCGQILAIIRQRQNDYAKHNGLPSPNKPMDGKVGCFIKPNRFKEDNEGSSEAVCI